MTTIERLQERRNRPWSEVEEFAAGEGTLGGETPEPTDPTARDAVVDARAASRAGRRRARLLATASLALVVTFVIVAVALVVRARTRLSSTEQLLDRSQHALETLIP